MPSTSNTKTINLLPANIKKKMLDQKLTFVLLWFFVSSKKNCCESFEDIMSYLKHLSHPRHKKVKDKFSLLQKVSSVICGDWAFIVTAECSFTATDET